MARSCIKDLTDSQDSKTPKGLSPFLDFLLLPLPIHRNKSLAKMLGGNIKGALFWAPSKVIRRLLFQYPFVSCVNRIIVAKISVKRYQDVFYTGRKAFSVECETGPFDLDDHVIGLHMDSQSGLASSSTSSKLDLQMDWPGLTLQFFYGHPKIWRNKFPLGKDCLVSGKLIQRNGKFILFHPEVLKTEELAKLTKTAQLEGRNFSFFDPEIIYPAGPQISQRQLSALIQSCIQAGQDLLSEVEPLPEWIPEAVLRERRWPSWWEAICALHRPKTESAFSLFDRNRQRLVFDELLAKQTILFFQSKQAKMKNQKAAFSLPLTKEMSKFIERLPFSLTASQAQVFEEIKADLQQPFRMMRLLQGDVGSGKTIIAFLAAAQAIFAGYQVSFLVPTDLLAKQHFFAAQKLFKDFGVSIVLYTRQSQHKDMMLRQLQSGHIQFLIGTHAIFQDKVLFQKLGLVLIDEQQRFGVEQRLKMIKVNEESSGAGGRDAVQDLFSQLTSLVDQQKLDEPSEKTFETTQNQNGVEVFPHVLSLSATPIPRTLFLSKLGEISLSNLVDKPKGRKTIVTKVMSLDQLGAIVDGLRRVLNKGEQVYWVCPLVEARSEKFASLTPAQERYNFLCKLFPGKVALVYGHQNKNEQQENMDGFIKGTKSILVATTVIEIGIDVPEASVMIIEHADRFGLSQLHQLRGRVGRGQKESSCLLLYGKEISEIAKERLMTLRRYDDGFKIAEIDLMLRGAGEVLGTKQSGSLSSVRLLSSLSFKPNKEGISEFDVYSSLLSLSSQVFQKIIQNQDLCSLLRALYDDV